MSAFIPSTWQASRVRIPGACLAIPQGRLSAIVVRVLASASPATAAEARRVMRTGGDLSRAAQDELAHLVARHAQICLAGLAAGRSA
jgi:hypothetical protein